LGIVSGIIGARVREKDLKKSPPIRKYKACRVEPLNMQEPNPLGPTVLEVLNCGFHKTNDEKARYQQSEKKKNHTVTMEITIQQYLTLIRCFFMH
jgi:hypothetical protein